MADERQRDDVDPTVRWLVHGVWKLALALVVILLVIGVVAAIVR
ncbi:MAG: hypothetical protein U0R69_15180 [Gaiellales bacterium]